MATEFYDFSLETIADPATPPAGLHSWNKTTGVGKIVDAGFARSTSNSNVAVWISSAFTPTDNFVKVEIVLGSNGVGGVSSSGGGIIVTADDSGSDDDGLGFFVGVTNHKEVSYNGTAGSLVGSLAIAKNNLINDVITLIVDRVNHKGYPFRNGNAIFKPVTLASNLVKYGVANNVTSIFKSLKIEDAGNTIPDYVGGVNNITPTGSASTFLQLNAISDLKYYGFKPKFARLNGLPVSIDIVSGDSLTVEVIPLNKLIGNVFPNFYLNANTNRVADLTFSDFTTSVNVEAIIQSSWVNLTTSSSTTGTLTDPSNINHYYDINGSTTGMPLGSLIINGTLQTTTTNTLSISTNGALTLIGLDNNIGTLDKDIYIKDGTDGILRKFVGTFDKANSPFGGMINLVHVPYHFVNAFEVDLDIFVTSNEVSITGANGLDFYVEGNGLLSYNTGTEWTDYVESSVGSPITVTSSLNPVPFKIQAKSSGLSDKERLFALKEDSVLNINYPWSIFTKIDTTVFVPDLQDDPEAIVIGLINHDNGTTFAVDDVDVIDVGNYTGVQSGDTGATLVAEANSGYNGSIDITYNRIDIDSFFNTPDSIEVSVAEFGTWVDVIAAVNSTVGINLTTDDYEDEPSFPGVEDDMSWTLTIKSTSLVYKGSTTVDIIMIV